MSGYGRKMGALLVESGVDVVIIGASYGLTAGDVLRLPNSTVVVVERRGEPLDLVLPVRDTIEQVSVHLTHWAPEPVSRVPKFLQHDPFKRGKRRGRR